VQATKHQRPLHCNIGKTIDSSITEYVTVCQSQKSPHVSTILTFTPTEPGAPLQMPLRSYSLPKKSLKVPSRHCSSRHCLQAHVMMVAYRCQGHSFKCMSCCSPCLVSAIVRWHTQQPA
jgi:hypothetical protein